MSSDDQATGRQPDHQEPLLFRPTPFTMLLPFVVFPCLGIVAGALAMAAVAEGGRWNVVGGVALAVLWALLWFGALVGYRRWFAIEVDAGGLSLIGLPGIRRMRIAWDELDAVGFSRDGRVWRLAVRPSAPWARPLFHGALRWDAERGLLGITRGRHWMPSAGELRETVRRYAGERWSDSLE